MCGNIRFVHTNLIAGDWKRLAAFYTGVFGCIPQYPERDLSGDWIDRVTAIGGVRVRGIHLALPGYESGPTLEIFEYEPANPADAFPRVNRQGFGHIAFHVDSVEEVLAKLVREGGSLYGEIERKDFEGIGKLTVVYARDPEGNIIELQNWQKP